jgi:hypothetical protein
METGTIPEDRTATIQWRNGLSAKELADFRAQLEGIAPYVY